MWTVGGLPDLSWFPQSSNSQWSQYFHSRATPASGLTHLVPCLWQWQLCMFPEKSPSSLQSFSSMYHNRCVSIAGQMFFPLCVAILVIQNNRPAEAQHISFLSQHMGFPLIEGWCLARPRCNMLATMVWPEGAAASESGSSDVLWTVPCYFHEPRSNGNWGCLSHIQFCTLKRRTGRENCTMAGLSLSTHKPLMQQYLP